MSSANCDYAVLTCCDGYTSFDTGLRTIRFRTPRNLERYVGVREWDNGYLVVDAQYKGLPAPVEEYIDLIPILKNLYIDSKKFLSTIKEVRVA